MHKDIWQQLAKGLRAAKELVKLQFSHLIISANGKNYVYKR